MNIAKSIKENPEEWTLSEHYLRHVGGVTIWIANGYFFFNLSSGGSFNFIQKYQTYRAYRWWLDNAPMESLGGFSNV